MNENKEHKELDKIKKIIDSFPEKCPYCFSKLKPRLFKPTSSVRYYCRTCQLYIDEEWDYMHAIADRVRKYLIVEEDGHIKDVRRSVEP